MPWLMTKVPDGKFAIEEIRAPDGAHHERVLRIVKAKDEK